MHNCQKPYNLAYICAFMTLLMLNADVFFAANFVFYNVLYIKVTKVYI